MPILRHWASGTLRDDLEAHREDIFWFSEEEIVDRRPEPIVSDGGRVATPTVDILIPAYDEAAVLADTVRAVINTDYPIHCRTISILVEPNDTSTRAVVSKLREDYPISEIVVPTDYPGEPNKPRALNYGFEMTGSEIVGVVDAEDLVEPTILNKVTPPLAAGTVDAVQGMLDMVNESDGWKNTIFRGEYGFWYRLFLPAAWRSGYPVPLGGSTNFIRRAVLEELSEIRIERFGHPWTDDEHERVRNWGLDGAIPWDPENVTEDFELGMLLWQEGYDVDIINTLTLEESPVSRSNWIRQRTRWYKGKLYTLQQTIRHPGRQPSDLGHLIAQVILPFYGLLTLLGIGIVLVLALLVRYQPPLGIQVLLAIGLLLIPIAIAVQTAGYLVATTVTDDRSRFTRTGLIVCLLPAYWVLMWFASARAVAQLWTGRLTWEKTTHNGNHADGANRGQMPSYRKW